MVGLVGSKSNLAFLPLELTLYSFFSLQASQIFWTIAIGHKLLVVYVVYMCRREPGAIIQTTAQPPISALTVHAFSRQHHAH